MTPYRPKGSRRWWCTLTTRDGRYVRLPTFSRDKSTADQMQAMLTTMQGTGKRWWDVIGHLETHRKELPRVFDHWVQGTVEEFRAQLADVDLAPGLTAWEAWVRREFSKDTIRHYIAQVGVVVPS